MLSAYSWFCMVRGDGSKVPCPECKFALPPSIANGLHVITCPICHAVIELAASKHARSEQGAAPRSQPASAWPLAKNLFLLVAFVISFWVWVDLELKKLPPVDLPKLPVIPPLMPELVTHPDAGAAECARLRAANGECVDGTTLRTCDDAGVVTEERCGLGVWPCERDGRCGPGARCCVPQPYVPALDKLRDAGITGAE